MNIQALGRDAGYSVGHGEMGHSIDLDRLSDNPVALDVGCRGFGWSTDFLKVKPAGFVVALDPDVTIERPRNARISYVQAALIGSDYPESMDYVSTTHRADGGAGFVVPLGTAAEGVKHPHTGWEFTDIVVHKVGAFNIHGISGMFDIGAQGTPKRWDVVKLDCEGEEFNILENWPGPIADQISVEFHDFTGPRRELVDAGYYDNKLWPHLAQWYDVVRHEWIDLNGQANHFGHWDSLLVLR